MDSERNKEVIREFDELSNGGGNLSRLDELCAPDIVNHALAPGRPRGIEGTREFLRIARRDNHPARWLWSEAAAENDLVIQFGSRELDWPGGSFRGFALSPGRSARDVMFAYRLADGRSGGRSGTTWQ